jgi:MATE family multidrug resistance protein
MAHAADTPTLPWADRPVAELLRLSWPIAVSTVSYSVMTLVDTLLLADLGAAVLAGVGLAGTAFWGLICFPLGLLRGGKVLVSQVVGAGRRGEYGAYLGAALAFGAGCGLAVTALGQAIALGLPHLAASAPSGDAARLYLAVVSIGGPFALAAAAIREARYGINDSRWPMLSAVVANLVNVVVAYVFIRVLGLGVAGAAWAVVIAHAVELGNLVLVQARDGFAIGATARRHLAALWRIGVPTGLQFLLETGSFALLTGMLTALADVEAAAHQIALQVIRFSFLPILAVAEAASVLVGQAMGARRDRLVHGIAYRALGVTAAYGALASVAFACGGRWIAASFSDDPALRRVTVALLLVAAVFQLFDAANCVARCVLRGVGDVRWAAAIGVITAWDCTPPMTWLLGWRLGWGALGAWLGITLEIVVGAALLWWRLERRAWLGEAAKLRAVLEAEAPVEREGPVGEAA